MLFEVVFTEPLHSSRARTRTCAQFLCMHRSREKTCALQLISVCPCVGNNELFVSNLASLLVKIEMSWHAMYSYIADSRWTHNIHDMNIRRENEDDEKTWSSGCARRQIMRGDAFDVWLTVEASDHHSTAPDMRNQLYLVNIIYVEIYARFE